MRLFGPRGAPTIYRLITSALFVLALAGCGDNGIQGPSSEDLTIPDPGAEAPIRTDADVYVLAEGPAALTVEIPFVYANDSGDDWYLVHCNGAHDFRLEKRIGDEWVEAYGPVLPQCLSDPPITIRAGEAWSGTILVHAVGEEGIAPRFLDDDPVGTYRIVLPTLSAFDPGVFPFGPTIAKADRVSNAFRLILAE